VSSETPTALVTGASRGIGREIARALAARGLHVIVNYKQSADAAHALCDEIDGTPFQADVADPSAVRAMVGAVRKQRGRLDVLVNNAGVLFEGVFFMTPLDRFWDLMHVNLGGVANTCRAAIPLMARHKRGRIVNIASIAAMHATEGLSAYAASKAAVIALSNVLARELAPSGITVNAVAPGLVETDMPESMIDAGARERAIALQPVQRMGSPEEVAEVVAWLAVDAPSYLTGEVIRVDGGALIS